MYELITKLESVKDIITALYGSVRKFSSAQGGWGGRSHHRPSLRSATALNVINSCILCCAITFYAFYSGIHQK